MVDDVDQLLGEQPYVDAMQDRAHRRHGKVGLQVFLVVQAKVPTRSPGPMPSFPSAAAKRRTRSPTCA